MNHDLEGRDVIRGIFRKLVEDGSLALADATDAERFLDALPQDKHLPTLIPEPDGEDGVMLAWRVPCQGRTLVEIKDGTLYAVMNAGTPNAQYLPDMKFLGTVPAELLAAIPMSTLNLPAKPEDFLREAVEPALALLPKAMDSAEARLMLVAISLQESGLRSRWQVIDPRRPALKGPARGLLQFECGTQTSRGGCWGVFLHPASRYWLCQLCTQRNCEFEPSAIWQRLETDDVLAAGLGRLLLFTEPWKLPALDDVDGSYSCYARNWRPGKPRPAEWPGNHAAAVAAVKVAVTLGA